MSRMQRKQCWCPACLICFAKWVWCAGISEYVLPVWRLEETSGVFLLSSPPNSLRQSISAEQQLVSRQLVPKIPHLCLPSAGHHDHLSFTPVLGSELLPLNHLLNMLSLFVRTHNGQSPFHEIFLETNPGRWQQSCQSQCCLMGMSRNESSTILVRGVCVHHRNRENRKMKRIRRAQKITPRQTAYDLRDPAVGRKGNLCLLWQILEAETLIPLFYYLLTII